MIKGHGGNIYDLANELGCRPSEIIDMSSNMNPLGPPLGLIDYLKEHMETINALPEADARASVHAFAKRYGLDPKRVLAGNGTTQFIYTLPVALKTNKALIIGPTYADYEDACIMHHVPFEYMFSDESKDFKPDFSKINHHLDGIDTVFICNSNNPTGVTVSGDALAELCRLHPEIRWIIDESYLPFADPGQDDSMISRNLSNVIVLSSLSKIFGIPGLRIGFMAASTDIVRMVAGYALPWSVNSLSQIAVEYLMANKSEVEAFIKETKDFLRAEKRTFIDTFISASHIRFFPSTTSFILSKLSEDHTSKHITGFFAKHGILIRDCSNFNGLPDRFIRVSLKSRSINQRVANMLFDLVEGQGSQT